MAIQVHRLKSNHDGSGRSQPAGGNMPSGNIPLFIDIGWYCWLWASSRLLSKNFLLQIKLLTCFGRVLTIFEKWSLNTYWDESQWCFRGWYGASVLLVWKWGNLGSRNTFTTTSHPTKCGGEVSFVITAIPTMGLYTTSLWVMPTLKLPSSW